MRIGIPKEVLINERRVALVPEVVGKLVRAGHEVLIESNAGIQARIYNEAFKAAGATIVDNSAAAWGADVVIKVAPPVDEEVVNLKGDSVLIGFLTPLTNPQLVRAIAATGATAFALESVPRISRAQSMDALSSQATVSGYRAAVLAASTSERFYPLLMTAAGAIPPAKVLVLGAGVAGLQAIATARRLGALVTGYDVRSAVKEQVESLGAKFLELGVAADAEGDGGYARSLAQDEEQRQQDELARRIAGFDIVISTALVPGKPAPRLITADAVRQMKPGSVIIDLAGEAGGNCEVSAPGDTIVTDNEITISTPLNLPSSMPEQASQLYARNVEALLGVMTGEDSRLALDFDDEVVAGTCIIRDGEIVNPKIREQTAIRAK